MAREAGPAWAGQEWAEQAQEATALIQSLFPMHSTDQQQPWPRRLPSLQARPPGTTVQGLLCSEETWPHSQGCLTEELPQDLAFVPGEAHQAL